VSGIFLSGYVSTLFMGVALRAFKWAVINLVWPCIFANPFALLPPEQKETGNIKTAKPAKTTPLLPLTRWGWRHDVIAA